jgi:NTE family protein
VLVDHGAPPLLSYALACSLAWHARRPTLLLAAGPPARELATLAERLQTVQPGKSRAHIRLVGDPHDWTNTVRGISADASAGYGHILLQAPAGFSLTPGFRTLHVGGHGGAVDHGDEYVVRSPVESGLARPNRLGELHVPGPHREDESALLRGLLPPTTPMGRVLGWAARDIAGLKVGVALGAGSAYGYAHIGALAGLEAAGIPIDYIAGASVGGCIAALHAAGYDHKIMAEVLDKVGASAWKLTVPRAGLLSTKALQQHFRHLGGDRRIEDLPVPLGIVAADIAGRREIVFRRGPIWPALLASIAIPGVFPPQRIGSFILVDGGVVNPVPGDVVAGMGADVVIAIKLVVRPDTSRLEAESGEPRGASPTLVQTVMRSIELMQSRITAAAAEAATVQIAVDLAGEEEPGLRHFSRGRRFIALGESAVLQALPYLAGSLPWLAATTASSRSLRR